jgi:protein-disulfide isomerase-like protein with CxxC motif
VAVVVGCFRLVMGDERLENIHKADNGLKTKTGQTFSDSTGFNVLFERSLRLDGFSGRRTPVVHQG